jgi:hypothetical protein
MTHTKEKPMNILTIENKVTQKEAMLFDGSDSDLHAVYLWIERNLGSYDYTATDENGKRIIGEGVTIRPEDGAFLIGTLEGEMEISRGDYVIKGLEGEFYPCKPGIFANSYNIV